MRHHRHHRRTAPAMIVALALSGVLTVGSAAVPVEAGAPPTTCAALPQGLSLIVPTDDGAAAVSAAGTTRLGARVAGPVHRAMRGPDGTVWLEHGATLDDSAIARQGPAETAPTEIARGRVTLTGVGWLDGRSSAAYLADTGVAFAGGVDATGEKVIDGADGARQVLGAMIAPEYGVMSMSIGADRVIEAAVTDLTETFDQLVVDPADEQRTPYVNPTADAPYNAPPFYQWPNLSDPGRDGTPAQLSWVEGPDSSPTTGELVGGWAVVVVDAVTGQGRHRVAVDQPTDIALLQASFDGRFWVGSFGDAAIDPATPPQPTATIAIDFRNDPPVAVDVGCATVATLDRVLSPPPAPVDDPCAAGYPDAVDSFPLSVCTEGPAVSVVQTALALAGEDLVVDGYLGPITQDAVRSFQQRSGLAVDGLVGPRTWAALDPGWFANAEDIVRRDADGDGVVGPWEYTGDDGARCAGRQYPIGPCTVGFTVAAVRSALATAGYASTGPELFYDETLGSLISRFQQDRGLEGSGFVDAATWAQLVTTSSGGVDADRDGALDPWEVGDAQRVARLRPTIPTAPCGDYAQADDVLPVSRCDAGSPVAGVQRLLAEAGYPVVIDGYFGNATTIAVLEFQIDNGLEPDGLVGTATWAALTAGRAVADADGDGTVEPSDAAPVDGT